MIPLIRCAAARLALVALLIATGCRAAPFARPIAPDPGPIRSGMDDGGFGDPLDESDEIDLLAQQAERDVAEFLQRRQAGADPADAAPTPAPEWDDDAFAASTGPRPGRRGSRGAADPGRGPLWGDRLPQTQPTLDDDVEPPPFLSGPLFRDSLTIDLAGDAAALDADPPPSAAAQLGAQRVNELIVQLSGELYREAAYDDVPLRELLLIAALTIADPQRTLEPQAIGGLTERERELLAEFQSFFKRIGRDLDGRGDAEEALAGAVNELRQSLSREPQLGLPRATLCSRVGGFGDFTEFTRGRETGSFVFLAHAERRAIVYVEIDEFTSELNEAGEWVTELSQQLVIYADRDGIPVWKRDWEPVVDRTRNKRSDFFTVQIITLPKALSVGRYHLKLRVRDEKSGAEAETSIPLEMVADPKMTSGG